MPEAERTSYREVVLEARQRGIHCLFGDPANRGVLEAARVAQAALVLVTFPEVDRAYLAIRNIRALNPEIPVLTRAHRRADYELLRNAGATVVVKPETEAAATLIAEALGFVSIPEQNVLAYISHYRRAMEIAHTRLHRRHPSLPELGEVPVEKFGAVGKRLKDSGIREQFGLTVVRVTRAAGETIFNPTSETLLASGDIVHVLGTDDQLESLNAKRHS
jgi:Trk K+ transport system NAD-binding subunit